MEEHIMFGISTCIIAKNEEFNIKQVIDSVRKFSNEVIVIDNNSTDNTASIAKQNGAFVFSYTGNEEHEQRNMYLKASTQEWIFVIDADERIDADSFIANDLEQIYKMPASILACYVPIIDFYGEGKWAKSTIVRLFRNLENLQYEDTRVHTSILTSIKTYNDNSLDKCLSILKTPIYHLDGLQKERSIKKRNIYKQYLLQSIEKFKTTERELKFHNYLGFEYAAAEEYDKAFTEFSLVLTNKLNNNHILPFYYMSKIKLIQGEIDTANYYIERYLKLCKIGRSPFTREILISRIQRGVIVKVDILIKMNKVKDAEKLLYTLPETPENLINMYFLKKYQNIIEEDLLKRAVEKMPLLRYSQIYNPIFRPNIYEFQSEFLLIVTNILDEVENL